MKRYIIFGTGLYYKNRKPLLDRYLIDDDIVLFLDNNRKMRECNNIPVYPPEEINKFNYDRILLMSKKSSEMKEQLLQIGVKEQYIWTWEDFLSEVKDEQIEEIYKKGNKYNRRILILSTSLNYNGGTIAATYATRILQERNIYVVLAAESGDGQFICEMNDTGLNLIVYPYLSKMGEKENKFFEWFDEVIVNVFQMLPFAIAISKLRPVLWWIHEPEYLIKETISKYPDIAKADNICDLNIYPVSRIAKMNFQKYFSIETKKELFYGIPDLFDGCCFSEKNKIVFAIIGGIVEIKAQDIFLNAAKIISDEFVNVEFWIIGRIGNDEYATVIQNCADTLENVHMFGNVSRERLHQLFRDIDVVVCPSRLDSLPIVATEAMMYAKPVIVSYNTGTVDFIEKYKNGLVCRVGDTKDLAEKMKWMILNRHMLYEMGINARRTYESYFTLGQFGDRLELALDEVMDDFYKR